MSNPEVTIRQATLADLDELVRLRRMMFESMGVDDIERLDAMDQAVRAYMATAMPAGQFYGWLAFAPDGETIASGGAVIDHHPPGPHNLSGRVGYIMNIVTIPRYRRQGIARRVMRAILDWAREQSIQNVALHASDMGKSLYASMGFADSNEMRRMLE